VASKYRDLVAQHDDLDCEVAVLAVGEPDQSEDATERLVQEREGHRRMLTASGADVRVQLTGRDGIPGTHKGSAVAARARRRQGFSREVRQELDADSPHG
jgi:hypothetical protein